MYLDMVNNATIYSTSNTLKKLSETNHSKINQNTHHYLNESVQLGSSHPSNTVSNPPLTQIPRSIHQKLYIVPSYRRAVLKEAK